jgi:hypothetical protein
MEPLSILNYSLAAIAAFNELLGYSPNGFPKNISQCITFSAYYVYKWVKPEKKEIHLVDVQIKVKKD